ncbi:hypothetical protein MPH_01616 [Macrophomina phaseolina MS6]|uniref:Uncharacterized protein n=1 Tax=Macrophomina phaseolina (strain MS6) TaxID=1126212 RepID=K2S841_MACPH|nr:hypothetical protein MPH_01616 [Macrophomina phaseolina MS6]
MIGDVPFTGLRSLPRKLSSFLSLVWFRIQPEKVCSWTYTSERTPEAYANQPQDLGFNARFSKLKGLVYVCLAHPYSYPQSSSSQIMPLSKSCIALPAIFQIDSPIPHAYSCVNFDPSGCLALDAFSWESKNSLFPNTLSYADTIQPTSQSCLGAENRKHMACIRLHQPHGTALSAHKADKKEPKRTNIEFQKNHRTGSSCRVP